jgi:hypothetical protein
MAGQDAAVESAEMAFRHVARRKLVERGYPEEEIDSKLTELLQKGASLRIDGDDILEPQKSRNV